MNQIDATIDPAPGLEPRPETCAVHGDYLSKPIDLGFGGKTIWTTCSACVREQREAAEARARASDIAAQQRRMSERLRGASIPARLAERSFDNYQAEIEPQKKALERVRSYVDKPDGRILVLSGETGTGKTHLAIAAINHQLGQGTALYTTSNGIVRMVRQTWGKDADQTEADVYHGLSKVGMLVIDEIGAGYQSDGEQVVLNEVIDIRYRDMMPTILVTNLGGEAFGTLMGDRVIDRLHECGIWVAMKWPSHRRRN